MSDENNTQTSANEEKKEEINKDTDTSTVEEKEEKQEVSADDTATEGQDVEVPEKFKSIVEAIESMSVLDLNELVKLLENKFGVSATAVAVAGPGVNDAGSGGDEKSAFDVELTEVGGQKIAVIKAIKEVLGVGLKEAKDMVDGAPIVIKEGMKKEDAESFRSKVEEAGGKVTLK